MQALSTIIGKLPEPSDCIVPQACLKQAGWMPRVVWYLTGILVTTLAMLAACSGERPSAARQHLSEKERPAKAGTPDLPMVAHPYVSLDPHRTVIWCGTMQLAWNKAMDLVGEDLHFRQQPALADLLNLRELTEKDLDPTSYIAIADFERNNIEDQIRAALEKTFHGTATPELIPEKNPFPGPTDFVAYSYLSKTLTFSCQFRKTNPLKFDSHLVESFGLTGAEEKDPRMFEQVAICSYDSEDDFVISLQTQSPKDQLILAKIDPEQTLDATIEKALKKAASNGIFPDRYPQEDDYLSIPKIHFKIKAEFSELMGMVLDASPKARIPRDPPLTVKKAEQLVRFELNEKGAILTSEALLKMDLLGGSDIQNKRVPLSMVFDRPFLILMKRTNSDRPYFACWIGDSRFMIPAKE